MKVTITPSKLRGTITPPPSKSQAHRLLIAAALADGESRIGNVAYSQDIEATLQCLEGLGAEFRRDGGRVTVRGMGANAMSPLRRLAIPRLDCGESGSTLRFLIPVALAVRGGGIFTGRERLMERPLGPYLDLFQEKGIFYEQKDGALTVQGMLSPGEYRLPGNVSSQFFTGLLYALPLLPGPSVLIPTTQLEGWGYIAMTLEALGRFGVDFPATMSLPPQYHLPGNQVFRPANAVVEADWSQAAFWYAAALLGNPVEVRGLNGGSAQGDRVIEDFRARLARPGDVSLDVSQCPDLVPALAAIGAVREGALTVENAARLRLKESDRLSAVAQVLNAMGADVDEGADRLVIHGKDGLAGGVAVDCRNDHRIAMMAAVAATRCRRPVTLLGAECVGKSYPNFWEDYAGLCGQITKDEETP